MSYFREVIKANNQLRVDFAERLVSRIVGRVKRLELPDYMIGYEAVFVIKGNFHPKDERFVVNTEMLRGVSTSDINKAFVTLEGFEKSDVVKSFFAESNAVIASKLISLTVTLAEGTKQAELAYEAKISVPIKAGFFNDYVADCEAARKTGATDGQV